MNWTNEKILKIAMEQSAFDANCSAEYFLPDLNVLAALPCDFELKLLVPADFDSMWQIGIDVLPEYRQKGIASALTSRLAVETLARGKVPFYCCVWSNIKSARNAIKSGFRPAWVEMTVKPANEVNEMNRRIKTVDLMG